MRAETSELPEPVGMDASEIAKSILLARDRLNALLKLAKENSVVVKYIVDIDGFVRILSMESTIVYYDYDKQKEE